jgi:sugar lactone lactonase YvrE
MDPGHRLLRFIAGGALTLALLTAAVLPALAHARVSTVVSYDPALGQLPEGVAVDRHGHVFVSLAPLSAIQKISRNGTASHFAALPPPAEDAFGLLGLTIGPDGRLYAALASGDPETQGVYRVSRDGSSERLPGTEAITFPNALTFDVLGNLYVTDTIFGAVWRIPSGGSAELWLQHPSLEGFILPDPGAPPVPLGANGVAYWRKGLYVANTSEAQIVRVPILDDGSAGAPEIVVKDPEHLTPVDGIALDDRGRIYAAVIAQSKVVRINPHTGVIKTIATAEEGLDFPASLAFGPGRHGHKKLYVTNFAIGPPGGAGPGLLSIDLGAPGHD